MSTSKHAGSLRHNDQIVFEGTITIESAYDREYDRPVLSGSFLCDFPPPECESEPTLRLVLDDGRAADVAVHGIREVARDLYSVVFSFSSTLR